MSKTNLATPLVPWNFCPMTVGGHNGPPINHSSWERSAVTENIFLNFFSIPVPKSFCHFIIFALFLFCFLFQLETRLLGNDLELDAWIIWNFKLSHSQFHGNLRIYFKKLCLRPHFVKRHEKNVDKKMKGSRNREWSYKY